MRLVTHVWYNVSNQHSSELSALKNSNTRISKFIQTKSWSYVFCLQRIFFDFICLQRASHQILSLKFLAPTVMMLLIVETFSLTLTLTVDNHRSLDWLLIFTRASLRVSWEMRVVQIHSTWFIFNRHQPMIRYHGTVSLKKEKSFLTKHQHYR